MSRSQSYRWAFCFLLFDISNNPTINILLHMSNALTSFLCNRFPIKDLLDERDLFFWSFMCVCVCTSITSLFSKKQKTKPQKPNNSVFNWQQILFPNIPLLQVLYNVLNFCRFYNWLTASLQLSQMSNIFTYVYWSLIFLSWDSFIQFSTRLFVFPFSICKIFYLIHSFQIFFDNLLFFWFYIRYLLSYKLVISHIYKHIFFSLSLPCFY